MLNITVIIHTRNAETTLSRLMESVRWAEECIVVDMDSHDRTCEIARQYGATVLQAPVVQRIDGIRNDFWDVAVMNGYWYLMRMSIWPKTQNK